MLKQFHVLCCKLKKLDYTNRASYIFPSVFCCIVVVVVFCSVIDLGQEEFKHVYII